MVLSSGASFPAELMKQNNPSKKCVYLTSRFKSRIFSSSGFWKCFYLNFKLRILKIGALKIESSKKIRKKKSDFEQLSWVKIHLYLKYQEANPV